jgi:hypothetical protein
MSEPNRMRLRTTIMVVSMVALPAAAVMGVKWPAILRSDRAWTDEKSSTAATVPDRATTAPIGRPQVSLEPSDYPVAQAENIVVRPEADRTIFPAGGENPSVSTVTEVVRTAAEESLEVQTNEEFTRIQQRLRGLGATHYMLETWGPTGEAYRSQCRMAAGHDAHYSRHFEATDVEPLRAMRTVLEDVESWKSGRLP